MLSVGPASVSGSPALNSHLPENFLLIEYLNIKLLFLKLFAISRGGIFVPEVNQGSQFLVDC